MNDLPAFAIASIRKGCRLNVPLDVETTDSDQNIRKFVDSLKFGGIYLGVTIMKRPSKMNDSYPKFGTIYIERLIRIDFMTHVNELIDSISVH